MIEIRTLGSAEVRTAGSGLLVPGLTHPRPLGLLVRLALQEGPLPRDALLPLFWPESDEEHARHALRQLLLRIRHEAGETLVVSRGRNVLALQPGSVQCDAVMLRVAARAERWEEVTRLYSGEFLPAFHVIGAPDFEEWVAHVRQELLEQAVAAARTLMRQAAQARHVAKARTFGEQALALAPYEEGLWREYLVLLTRAGHSARARALYRRLAARLNAELGVTPSPRTEALVRRLWPTEARRAMPAAAASAHVPAADSDASRRWAELRKRALSVSRRTLHAVRQRSGLPWDVTIRRAAFHRHLERFLRSSATATAFMGPAGCGKTIGLAHEVERLWLSADPVFPADVVWYVQVGDMAGLTAAGANLPVWLLAQPGFPGDDDILPFFEANPGALGGRVVLVVDGLDRHALDGPALSALTNRLLAVVAANRHPWFRVVLALRSAAWHRIVDLVDQGAVPRTAWFGVRWSRTEEEQRNVPLLRETEVRRIVQRAWPRQRAGAVERLPVEWMLREPAFLQLFLQGGGANAPTDEVGLVERYLQRRVLGGVAGAERADVLRAWLEQSRLGRSAEIDRRLLAPTIERLGGAYEELLSAGVLAERRRRDAVGMPLLLVGVGQPHVLDSLIVRHWIGRTGITVALFQALALEYEGNILRLPLLTWACRYTLRAGAWDVLEHLFDLPLPHSELQRLGRAAGFMLRREDAARRWLLPRWAGSDSARVHYFENFVDQDYLVLQYADYLPDYIAARPDRDARIFGHAMLLLAALLRLDSQAAAQHVAALDALEPGHETHPLPLGRALAYRLLFRWVRGGVAPVDAARAALEVAATCPPSDDRFATLPACHVFLLEALNLCGLPELALAGADAAHRAFPRFHEQPHRTAFHILFITQEAKAHAMMGQVDPAMRALRSCGRDRLLYSPRTFPSYHYAELQYRLAVAEIEHARARHERAARAWTASLKRARGLGYRLYESVVAQRLESLGKRTGR